MTEVIGTAPQHRLSQRDRQAAQIGIGHQADLLAG
jgi:hypothetical protein